MDAVAYYRAHRPQAAERVGRDPETVRRWIRSRKLPARRAGTEHVIDEKDLDELIDDQGSAPLPEQWRRTWTGESQPDWVRILRRSRRAR